MGPFKKYVTYIMAFFCPIQLCQTLSILLYHFLCERKKKEKIISLEKIEFSNTDVCIKNPHWQSSEIIIFMCEYDIIISDTLVSSFLDVLFLLLAVILSELHEKPRRNDWVTEKSK